MRGAVTVVCLVAAVGCASEEESATAPIPGNFDQARATYVSIVRAAYADSVSAAVDLQSAVNAFLETPSEATLTAAREAWLDSRESYLQTEAFRFYDGPIDHPEDGVEGRVNAWPLDEAYIDYVEGDPTSGIIGDSSRSISAEALSELNEAGGEKNIATGYHAIEFLLWGQDRSETGPGARPFSDYVIGAAGSPSAERRRLYLKTVTDLLVSDLETVRSAWADGAAYHGDFTTAAPADALRRILTGLTVLSGFETGGERIQTALDSGDQEDEHSCFSDNTHRDMVQDVRGVQNVWLGRYVRTDGSTVEGPGLDDVIAVTDAALASRITQEMATSLTLAEALKPPFDTEIRPDNTEGHARVAALAEALRKQARTLEGLFGLYGIAIPVTP